MSEVVIFIIITVSVFLFFGAVSTSLLFWSYNKQKKISKNIFLFMDDPISYDKLFFDPTIAPTNKEEIESKYAKYITEDERIQYLVENIETCNEIVQYSNKLDLINEQNTKKIIDDVFFVDSKNMHDEFVEKERKIKILVTNKRFYFIILNGKKIIIHPINKLDKIVFLFVGFCCIAKMKFSAKDDITLFIDSKEDVQNLITLVKVKQYFAEQDTKDLKAKEKYTNKTVKISKK